MRAWRGQTVPALTELGPGPAVRIHDTATGKLAVSPAGGDGTARLYVCGITPYDATHIGHASTYVAFDLLNRAWRDAGHEVRYVQNVTDVDDPLLERADRDGEDWRALAEREIERFRGDCEALGILPPDDYVGVVESIEVIVEMVEELRAHGHAYEVDGDWYFSVRSDPAFGQVGHFTEEEMVTLSAQRGGDPDRAGKKDPIDCLLWRAERPGEPSWPSPMGPGRPGWHVECSAIALRGLGDRFDVQGGGSDLVFPHHEMSAAQAQAAAPGTTFASAYVHAGMVAYQGEKMSKSLGNLVFVSELRQAGVDPAAIRVAIMNNHYRSDWEWTDDALPAAEQRLSRWRAALVGTSTEQARELGRAVRAALADDLDAPSALRAIDAWAAGERGSDDRATDRAGEDLVRALLDARLGLPL